MWQFHKVFGPIMVCMTWCLRFVYTVCSVFVGIVRVCNVAWHAISSVYFFYGRKKKIGRMKYYMVCRVPHSWTKVMSQSGEFKVNANHCIQNDKIWHSTLCYVFVSSRKTFYKTYL